MQTSWLWNECSACQRIDTTEIVPGNSEEELHDSAAAREELASPIFRKGTVTQAWPRVGLERLEGLTQELFRLHDFNGDGLLEENDLVSLNEAIATLHHGPDVDVAVIRSTYKDLFRSKLDAQGRAVPYAVFRTYSHEVLDGLDGDPDAQEMILEQFVAEAQSGREAVDAGLELSPARGTPRAIGGDENSVMRQQMLQPPSDEPAVCEDAESCPEVEATLEEGFDDQVVHQVPEPCESCKVVPAAPSSDDVFIVTTDIETVELNLEQVAATVAPETTVDASSVSIDQATISPVERELSIFEYPAEPSGGSIDGEAALYDLEDNLAEQSFAVLLAAETLPENEADGSAVDACSDELDAKPDNSTKSAESTCCTPSPTPSESPPLQNA